MNANIILAQIEGAATTGEAPAAATPAAQPAAPAKDAKSGTVQTTDKPAEQPAQETNFLGSPLVMFLIIGVLFYFLLIRPQRKQQKEQQARLNALKVGDSVITNAGIHGEVRKIDERTVDVQIAKDVTITLEKAAIINVKSKD
ncbi:preprotein translocase subunit YajC [Akkermansia glycaniphila]|uniref:preprotein translocase subunit YajC n=1 Tax=Akkermansia glycaniphila TaxID=1679444 RepID=UPI001C035B0B|nr:preprotein translocase subunit YajC [Akkermansia glycaniphila]MBT9449048.1 preprotein translocase subunit YajC [Akkermansia glycaniphila]